MMLKGEGSDEATEVNTEQTRGQAREVRCLNEAANPKDPIKALLIFAHGSQDHAKVKNESRIWTLRRIMQDRSLISAKAVGEAAKGGYFTGSISPLAA